MPANNASLAIIPARGGSKRIPRKNIRLFAGAPVIKYSIDAALASGCFDEVMVSTDDPEIAALSEKLGAMVPFMRSGAAAGDHATTAEVIAEVLSGYASSGRLFKYACCIYPAAPFVTPEMLKRSYEELRATGASSVFPVVRFPAPIQRALALRDGKLRMFWPENRDVRSQDLEPAYHDAGQFYWLDAGAFMSKKAIFTDDARGLEVPASEVQDIDTPEDWAIAELKFRLLRERA